MPWLVVHGGPISSYLSVDVPVSDCGQFQLFAQPKNTSCCHVMLDCPVNESASLAWFDQAIEGAHDRIRQDDVDTFSHGVDVS